MIRSESQQQLHDGLWNRFQDWEAVAGNPLPRLYQREEPILVSNKLSV